MKLADREEQDGSGPIRVPKTAEVVAEVIRKRIILGELQEGAFLPPEGQLMATLAISRPTLREAFRILEAERLISVVRGSRTGAKVHRPRVEGVARYAGYVLQSEGTTMADIYEARLAIEPYVARRLALTRPADAIARLREEVDRLTAIVTEERYIDFMIGLAEFHRLLVEAGGNRTLHFVTRMLQGLVTSYQVRLFQQNPLPIDEQKRRGLSGLRSFRKLIDLMEAGEADKAEEHWRLHVINANKAWVPEHDRRRDFDVFG
ncbi:FadR/GntR family transcriptional regulator [Sphingomonas bacterium]|uniref:FadR/GntR family transcriptional regulator n=1 Tax=Sphingomonas bacterium TaxID=1895847 RepID=UPI00157740AF|nr:FCD domain-containing protein [Sphingomonas bacterium]